MTPVWIMPRGGAGNVPAPLHMRLERHGQTVVAVASGEVDIASADRLEARLRGLLSDFRRIVLDLRQVLFVDCSALHRLLDIQEESRATGVDFALVPGPPQVQRLFELTRTGDMFRFIDRVDTRNACPGPEWAVPGSNRDLLLARHTHGSAADRQAP